MATQGGDIRFTFTGDSSGLNSELKKIDKNLGEVSKATAGASNGMQKGLVKGAKAADKAADKMAASIGKAKAEMDQAATSADKMGNKMEAAGDAAGSTDSSLSGVGAALGQVNPKMGELAGTAGDAAGAMEGLLIAARAHPVAFAAVALSVTMAGLAFGKAQQAAEDFEHEMEKATRQSDKNLKAHERSADILEQVDRAHHDATEGISGFTRGLLDQLDELDASEKALERRIRTQIKSGEVDKGVGKRSIKLLLERTAASREMLSELAANERKIRKDKEASVQASKDLRDAERAAADAAKDRAAEELRIAKEAADRLALLDEELDFEQKMEAVKRSALEFRLDEVSLIKQNAAVKMAALQDEFAALNEQLQAEPHLRQALAEAVTAVHQEMNNDLLESDRELIEKEKKLRKEQRKQEAEDDQEALDARIKARDDAFSASLEITSGVLNITRQLEEDMATASIEERERLFNIQKGASIADATINGAVAITRALAELGPVAGAIAAGAIAATTAAQISLIAGEEPAFDVGGMVRGGVLSRSDDQMSARVLPGEAILNRSATESLGEGGVNALNRGSGLGGVTVVPAYRHFDRFIRDEYRKGGAFRRIVTRERDYPVGQRRY